MKALADKKNVIVLERTDDQLATENALARDIRSTIYRARKKGEITALPRIFNGIYGSGLKGFQT